ncbi:WhiB family transcriptional regulator [Pseudonocardia sp. KRD-291]|nr:WhiB family transcriptional regulator [Pseudonocardia sp. KRD291]
MVGREQGTGEARDWRSSAACRDRDPEMFFPTAIDGPALERAEVAAKRVCAGCPVQPECLAWAVEDLPFGVAGGLGETERAGLRRSARPVRRRRRPGPFARPVCSVGRTPSESREAGYAALAGGGDRDRVAQTCGVSRRTVDRWAAALRDGVAGGAR